MSPGNPYEFDAHKYRQASIHQQEWGARLISELNLTGNERILDLGCGDGQLTMRLAELVPNGSIVGIDSSENMIRAANESSNSRLSFRQLDINELDYVDEFDLIFSNAALHWVTDHSRLLNNVHRALKGHGLCRFNFAGDGNCQHLITAVKALIGDGKYATSFLDFAWPWFMPTVQWYSVAVEQLPFREHHVWEENADRNFPSAEAMTAWIDQPSLVPFLRQLDGSIQHEFRNQAVTEILRATRQPNGTHFETFRRLNVLARK